MGKKEIEQRLMDISWLLCGGWKTEKNPYSALSREELEACKQVLEKKLEVLA